MLTLLSALILGGRAIKEASEPKLPAEYHGNWQLEAHDSNEVRMGRMTQKQFEKNMNSGKYYAPINKTPDPTNARIDEMMKRIGTYNPNYHPTVRK